MPARSHLRLFLVLIWSLVVAGLLLTPGDELPDDGTWGWLEQPLHGVLFGIHCGLLACPLPGSGKRGLALTGAVLVSGLYGVLLEAAQIAIPGRSWEWWDLVANSVGIAAVALLIAVSRARLRATS